MAVPFRRTSKTKKRKRRTHFKLNVPGMITCPNCGEMKLAHRVCPNCGYYDNKAVVTIKEKDNKQLLEIDAFGIYFLYMEVFLWANISRFY